MKLSTLIPIMDQICAVNIMDDAKDFDNALVFSGRIFSLTDDNILNATVTHITNGNKQLYICINSAIS